MSPRRSNLTMLMLAAVAVVVVVAAFRTAAVVVLPIIVSIYLAMLMWPLHKRLDRYLWSWLSAGVSVAAIVVALGAVGGLVWYAMDSALAELQGSSEKYAEQYRDAVSWATERGAPARVFPRWPEDGDLLDGSPNHDPPEENGGEGSGPGRDADNPGEADGAAFGPGKLGAVGAAEPRENPWEEGNGSRGLSAVTGGAVGSPANGGTFNALIRDFLVWVTGGLGSTLAVIAAAGLSLALMFLALVENGAWWAWAEHRLGRRWTDALHRISSDCTRVVRKYFLAKTIVGVISGTATGLWLWFMDVPLPLVWGVLTFALNFIPNIGAWISGLPPTLLAFLELGLWQGAAVVAGLIVIEAVSGNLLDPLVQGDALDLSPYLVLASLLFWGWVWGIVGAVLAPTLTATIIVIVKHVRRSAEESAAGDPVRGSARAETAAA